MNINRRGTQETSIAGSLLAARLGELLVAKGVITPVEAAQVIEAAQRDALAPRGWIPGPRAAEIIEEVGWIWARAKASIEDPISALSYSEDGT